MSSSLSKDKETPTVPGLATGRVSSEKGTQVCDNGLKTWKNREEGHGFLGKMFLLDFQI